MANNSSIEWTEATWNPATGCTKVSAGCKNCYAEKMSNRLKLMESKKYKNNFQYTEHFSEINKPLRWKKSRRIFVNSMSDLFHELATTEFLMHCFNTMMRADWHTYQILTKRPQRMAAFTNDLFFAHYGHPVPLHIWCGTSVEDNKTLGRIDELRRVRCSVRFVSFEPLLEDISQVNLSHVDWAIIGGESGANYRKCEKHWVENLIQQCEQQNVRVFFKQWGGTRSKSNGRILNGRTYDEYPDLDVKILSAQ